jgi:hypothetical protein
MSLFTKKQLAILLLLAFVLIGSAIALIILPKKPSPPEVVLPIPTPTTTPVVAAGPTQKVIGTSVEGRAIEAYTYGNGATQLVFVGGVHGGYEWNSVLLAYTFMDYLRDNPSVIPPTLSVTVIPSLNPDGVFAVVGKEGRFVATDIVTDTKTGLGRFNAHDVDLNRNFDCKWQAKSTWRSKAVSAGTEAFSEPEAAALRDFVVPRKPAGVIFWHSQANAVYASECMNGILPETRTLMNTYAKAAAYPSVDTFDAYPVTGDAEGWLASINIPAITVELKTHETIEWEKNIAGIKALLTHYAPVP